MNSIQNIRLAFACDEKLDNNNFCNKCTRQIHDFRNATTEDLAIAVENSSRPVCGIFSPTQLNNTFLKVAAATLIAVSLSGCSIAQEPGNKSPDPVADVEEMPIVGMISVTMPSYKGGLKNMMETIRKNLRCPKDCIEGNVFVSFVVKANGTIADRKVMKGISPEVDQEAMRVIDLLTEWIPGEQGGKKVDVRMVLPVKFSSVVDN